MSDDQEEIEERPGFSLYNLLRKLMFILAAVFVVWTYVSKSFNGPHPVKPGQKPDIVAAKELPKEEPQNTADQNIAAPVPPPVQQPAPAVVSNNNEEIAALRQRIDQLEAKLEAATRASANTADKGSVTHLEDKITEQDKSLQDIKAQIKDVSEKSNRELSLLTAFGIMKDTIHSGESFTVQLNQMYKLLPADNKNGDNILELLEKLKPYADKGVPTWPVLQQQFGDLLPLALAPYRKDNSWEQNLRSLIRIRKEGEKQQGGDDEAILARAEAKLARHDIAATLKELETLSKPAADILAPWMANAQGFVTTGNTLDALQLALSTVPNA